MSDAAGELADDELEQHDQEQREQQLDPGAGDPQEPADAGDRQPDPIRHNDRVLIVGKTESGKSVLARHLWQHFTGCRRTFIDPKDSGISAGVQPARSPAEIDIQAPVSHYVPNGVASDEEWEEVFGILWRARGPRSILLDESYGPTRAGFAPPSLRAIVQQGRGHDVGLLACTQRPVNIEATLRTEAEHVLIFVPAPPMIDLRTLAGDIGQEPDGLRRELEELQQTEGPHSHLWYCRRTGSLHRCAPLPPAWAA